VKGDFLPLILNQNKAFSTTRIAGQLTTTITTATGEIVFDEKLNLTLFIDFPQI
jgi:hypothetical protein